MFRPCPRDPCNDDDDDNYNDNNDDDVNFLNYRRHDGVMPEAGVARRRRGDHGPVPAPWNPALPRPRRPRSTRTR